MPRSKKIRFHAGLRAGVRLVAGDGIRLLPVIVVSLVLDRLGCHVAVYKQARGVAQFFGRFTGRLHVVNVGSRSLGPHETECDHGPSGQALRVEWKSVGFAIDDGNRPSRLGNQHAYRHHPAEPQTSRGPLQSR